MIQNDELQKAKDYAWAELTDEERDHYRHMARMEREKKDMCQEGD